MIFSSTVFTFVFLPIVLLIYYLAKDEYKNLVLLVVSLIFYSYGEPKNIVIMMLSVFWNWGMALLISHFQQEKAIQIQKIILLVAILGNLFVLYIFKYLDFSITVVNGIFGLDLRIFDIALPIGISFYTFQAISYVIDVYRKDGEMQKSLLNVGLYIAFFPQLVAGPIVRYSSFATQLRVRRVTAEKFEQGVKRFLLGFMKKILLANNIALVAEEIFHSTENHILPIGVAWIGAISYTLQIYYDFSGYSDMAIGLGKMFGFDFQENFNYPYIASSITDFWRRWHISLSQWFRDYVYIPLGGSRVSAGRHIINLFMVWLLTGIWHGANYTFVLWGLIYFVFLLLEKYITKPEKRNIFVRVVWRICTLGIIVIAWVFFYSESLSAGVTYCMSMFGLMNNPLWSIENQFTIQNNIVFVLAGLIFCIPTAPWISGKIGNNNRVLEILSNTLYILGFIWSISYLVLGAHNPFIYYNF